MIKVGKNNTAIHKSTFSMDCKHEQRKSNIFIWFTSFSYVLKSF